MKPRVMSLVIFTCAVGLLTSPNKIPLFDSLICILFVTIGAGDFFAAGYLYGLQKNLTIDESANFANKSAAHVISEIGVRPEKDFS